MQVLASAERWKNGGDACFVGFVITAPMDFYVNFVSVEVYIESEICRHT